jgi:hypothetical protein
MSGDVRILDGKHLINVLAFDPLCRDGGRGDGRTTAEGFEFRFLDDTILVDPDLQLQGEKGDKSQIYELTTTTMICWLNNLPSSHRRMLALQQVPLSRYRTW